jgi:hypothetical protein
MDRREKVVERERDSKTKETLAETGQVVEARDDEDEDTKRFPDADFGTPVRDDDGDVRPQPSE